MAGPLKGVRVLDFTWNLAGPYCTMILSDLGAEVIKIESPEGGDPARKNFPHINGKSSYFLSVNRGKKSVTVNLRNPRGREIVLELAKRCDVIVENFRPGVLDRLSLGYSAIEKVNPKIIYAACSGFGQNSPYAHRPAYDVIVQGMGGTLSITGEAEGHPARVGFSIGDIGGGIFMAIGILSALHGREKNGKGQMVEISMLDCQIAFLENAFARFFATGEIAKPIGTRHPVHTPFQAFPTKDGFIVLAAAHEQWWQKLCQVLDRPDLLRDDRFKDDKSRTQNHAQLEVLLSEITRGRTTEDWVVTMEQNDIPCGPVNTVAQVASDPHTVARNMIIQVKDSKDRSFRVVNSPIKLSENPIHIERASPDLGEHTDEVLAEILGLSNDQISDLRLVKAV
jgi:CoA:oxalate CoA-transferase